MSHRRVVVTAPSRLHFGMFSFGRTDARQFGGLGLMVDQPGLSLSVQVASELQITGPLAESAEKFARHVAEHFQTPPHFKIDILTAPRPHIGLGSGTQLSMSIAAGIGQLLHGSVPAGEQLALASGRGSRSSVGMYGFTRGGLLAEAGKLRAQQHSPLIARAEIPAAWRLVLLSPRDAIGLSGEAERSAFARLPAVSLSTTATLCQLAFMSLIPAAIDGDFETFSRDFTLFNRLAGACFSSEQGGEYAGEEVRQLVDLVRSAGVDGVAQSSWGPTVAALFPTVESAQQFASCLPTTLANSTLDVVLATPNTRGATIEVVNV